MVTIASIKLVKQQVGQTFVGTEQETITVSSFVRLKIFLLNLINLRIRNVIQISYSVLLFIESLGSIKGLPYGMCSEITMSSQISGM